MSEATKPPRILYKYRGFSHRLLDMPLMNCIIQIPAISMIRSIAGHPSTPTFPMTNWSKSSAG